MAIQSGSRLMCHVLKYFGHYCHGILPFQTLDHYCLDDNKHRLHGVEVTFKGCEAIVPPKHRSNHVPVFFPRITPARSVVKTAEYICCGVSLCLALVVMGSD